MVKYSNSQIILELIEGKVDLLLTLDDAMLDVLLGQAVVLPIKLPQLKSFIVLAPS